MNEEEARKSFKTLLRRTKYSMALLGLVSHSCISSLLFYRGSLAPQNYALSDMVGLVAGFILCAAIIETGMLIVERKLK